MPTPKEQATEGSPADPAVAGPPAGPASGEFTAGVPAGDAEVAEPAAAPASGPLAGGSNGWATGALVSGILGMTGIGAVLGICFGVLGLRRSRRGSRGAVRSWAGIVMSFIWAGAFIYVAPHVIKAADPGCTAFKESALTHYNKAIEDFGDRTGSTKTAADLSRAISYLRAAAAKSKNAESRKALNNLVTQLARARADENSGHIPASVILALNHDAAETDNACGTL
jgi:hypothetical protein